MIGRRGLLRTLGLGLLAAPLAVEAQLTGKSLALASFALARLPIP